MNSMARKVVTNERIPIIPLDYTEKELALKKELILDYDNYRIYVVDSEDRNIIHDLTQVLIDEYLTNIDGDNVWVTIEGIEGKVNLSQILSDLYKSKIEVVNTLPAELMTPTNIRFDHKSVTVEDNTISIYGFKHAKPLSTPRKGLDGTIEWIAGEDDTSMDNKKSNVIYIYPNKDQITLFQKSQQYTILSQYVKEDILNIHLPKTNEEFYQVKWRVDSAIDAELVFSEDLSISWYGGDDNAVNKVEAYATYLFTFDTWDFGETWTVKCDSYYNLNIPDLTYLEEKGYILTDETGTWLYYNPPSINEVPNIPTV